MMPYQFLLIVSSGYIFHLISTETLTASSSLTSIELNQQHSTDIVSTSGRSRSFQRQQSVYSKNKSPFSLHNGNNNNPSTGCCPCSECCACDSGADYSEAYDDVPSSQSSTSLANPGSTQSGPMTMNNFNQASHPNMNNNFNRYGSATRRSVIVRRRYTRPNGITVVEVEESPNPSSSLSTFGNINRGEGLVSSLGSLTGGTSLFGNGGGGSGLFSRFIPSALERNNSTRSRSIVQRKKHQSVTSTINNSTKAEKKQSANQQTSKSRN